MVATAEVKVSVGINLSTYPDMVVIPGYPVYYAPQLFANYFFYDGMYWVYQDDNWYTSSWFNGPWVLVDPEIVPVYVLRVPVGYYRRPPFYFFGWQADFPPRWGDRWGYDWRRHRNGWDRWNHSSVPAPAPIPIYQRQYAGNRYPHRVEQQQKIQKQNYRYQPSEPGVQQHYQQQVIPGMSATQTRPQPGRAEQPGKSEQPGKTEQPHKPELPGGANTAMPVPSAQPGRVLEKERNQPAPAESGRREHDQTKSPERVKPERVKEDKEELRPREEADRQQGREGKREPRPRVRNNQEIILPR